jgi:hypothetical protein
MLRTVARWTDEALDHPQLWKVVEALTEELVTVKTRMSGNRVERIIRRAWGHGSYLEMGPQWRRRFAATTHGGRAPSMDKTISGAAAAVLPQE